MPGSCSLKKENSVSVIAGRLRVAVVNCGKYLLIFPPTLSFGSDLCAVHLPCCFVLATVQIVRVYGHFGKPYKESVHSDAYPKNQTEMMDSLHICWPPEWAFFTIRHLGETMSAETRCAADADIILIASIRTMLCFEDGSQNGDRRSNRDYRTGFQRNTLDFFSKEPLERSHPHLAYNQT